jgi:Holliday junction DNA helicase RuvB
VEDSTRVTHPGLLPEERNLDESLRPRSVEEFVGQNQLKEKLRIFLEAAKLRGESLEHILFYGPPGLGKTTLAKIVALEADVSLTQTSGPAIEKPGDLAGLLTNLKERDVLFIDEIHRLSHVVEEYLYPAMEDFALDIMLDRGPSARSVRLNLRPFTLIGATTRAGLITSPLRARFGFTSRIDFYGVSDLITIVNRSARILDIEVDEQGAQEIASRARGTPRVANRLLRRVRDFAQVRSDGKISAAVAHDALRLLEVDQEGLDEMDRRILFTVAEKFSGGPVGLNSLATAVGEEADTIEDVYEPYLIQMGFLERTPRGRVLTPRGSEHINLRKSDNGQGQLF